MADSDLWLFHRLTRSLGVFDHLRLWAQPSHKVVCLPQQPVNQAFIYRARGSCFSFIMTKVMWKYWIFTLGLTLFSLGFKDDIIPQHAEERSDLYCLWKPFQHNCGPFFIFFFFFFKSAGITGKMREKSHLSSVQQKQHILTSHWVCKMWFPEKGAHPPPPPHPRMAALLKCERWSRRRFHFDTSTTILFLCHRVPEPTPASGPPSEGRVEDGCSCELKWIRLQRFEVCFRLRC